MKSQSKADSINILTELPFDAPKGYHYEVTEHKRNVLAVWLCGGPTYLCLDGNSARTIHSFYNTKKGVWYAPIDKKTVGKEVSPSKMRPWTSMQINYNPLEQLLYG